ncbi:glycosyltransferase family A protein [soil metagenome]
MGACSESDGIRSTPIGGLKLVSDIGVGVDRIGVVVPVHNEQDTLRECLKALLIAASRVSVPVTIVVVLDACHDASAIVVQHFRSVHLQMIAVDAHCVGAARAAGMAEVPAQQGHSGTWLATTDADSVVPPHWLSAQLQHARSGALVVAGTVTVEDWQDHSLGLAERARRDYQATPHRHIHGANLSFSAHAYRRAGGFRPVQHDEDVSLVEAFNANSEPVVWATDLAVTTSARRNGRAPRGFAGYLSALEHSMKGSIGA